MEKLTPKWRGVCILGAYNPVKERRVCNGCEFRCTVVLGLNDPDPEECLEQKEGDQCLGFA